VELDTIQAIMQRRSVRAYRPQPIPERDLMTILECGRQAPSASNRQPWRFMVATEANLKRQVARACLNQNWMADAGAIVAVVAFPEVSPNWYAVDAAIALQTMVIAARSLGYGTCWIGAFREDEVRALLKVPAGARVVALSPIGVPVEWPAARERKGAAETFAIDPK